MKFGAALALVASGLLLAGTAVYGDGGRPSPRLIAVNQDDSTISFIATATNDVISTLHVARSPAVLALSRDERFAYITHPDAGKISVVDIGKAEVRSVFSVPGEPFGIAAVSSSQLFVGDWSGNVVRVIDAGSGDVLKEIGVGKSPAWIVAAPDGGRVFVADRESDAVSVIDTHALVVTKTLSIGKAPFALQLSVDGKRLYVANAQGGDLTVFDVENLKKISTVRVGAMPYGVAATQDGRRVLVTNQQSGSVSIIGTSDWSVAATVRVGRYPEGIALLRDDTRAYVANWFGSDISVIDLQASKEISRIKAGSGVRSLVVAAAPRE